jgi:hypothetical protein
MEGTDISPFDAAFHAGRRKCRPDGEFVDDRATGVVDIKTSVLIHHDVCEPL